MKRKPPRGPAPAAAQVAGGPGPTVVVGTARYRMSLHHQQSKATLEALVEDHVTLKAVRQKRRLGGSDGEEAFAAAPGLIDAGHYRTMAPGWTAVLRSPDGEALFPLALFREHHPEMTADECRAVIEAEPEQVAAALGRVTPDFFRAAALDLLRRKGVPADRAAAAAEALLADPRVAGGLAALAAVGGATPAGGAAPPPTPGPPTG